MNKLDFNLYVGGKGVTVDRAGLAAVHTPAPEGIWHPVPHLTMVEQLETALVPYNIKIVNETFKLDKGGKRMFGMLQVANCKPDNDFSFAVGLRNGHDKCIRAGLAVGMGVGVCSNLSFRGEIVIGRKHTTEILVDLPDLMTGAIAKLADKWNTQEAIVAKYKETGITITEGNDLLVKCARAEVFPRSQFMDVADEWATPRHPEFNDRNLWSLFNCVTEHLKPRQESTGGTLWILPERTERLHSILDPVAHVELLAPEVQPA